MDKEIKEAFELAKKVKAKAYSAYSKFSVGAVIKTKNSDTLFVGNNVENAVNGASVCAERSAVSHMVAQQGASDIEWVVVLGDKEEQPTAPCGVCRQVLFEFCSSPDTPIYMFTDSGNFQKSTIGELLPFAYDGKDFLKK